MDGGNNYRNEAVVIECIHKLGNIMNYSLCMGMADFCWVIHMHSCMRGLCIIMDYYYIVDGGWSNWSVGNCSKSCGGGVKKKTRSCSNPLPSCGGDGCVGKTIETVDCNTMPCIGLCMHNTYIRTWLYMYMAT